MSCFIWSLNTGLTVNALFIWCAEEHNNISNKVLPSFVFLFVPNCTFAVVNVNVTANSYRDIGIFFKSSQNLLWVPIRSRQVRAILIVTHNKQVYRELIKICFKRQTP